MHQRSDLPLSVPFSDEDRRALLALARLAISETVSMTKVPDLLAPAGRLAGLARAFVTLRCNGKLRGCIGRTDARETLAEVVAQCAITAALGDPRFKPLRTEEMAALEIEISVLSEPWPSHPDEIALGTHGVIVSRDSNRGLLLPQAAIERNWSVSEFLEAACRKAGLLAGAWRDAETNLFAFTAEVFSEASLIPAEPRSSAQCQQNERPGRP
jgi:AmmeMemoRadiSam system protein A